MTRLPQSSHHCFFPSFLPPFCRVGTQPPWREQTQLSQADEVQGAEIHQKPCGNHWLGETVPCPVAAMLPSTRRWEGRETERGEDSWTPSAPCHGAKSLNVLSCLCRARPRLGAGALQGETPGCRKGELQIYTCKYVCGYSHSPSLTCS